MKGTKLYIIIGIALLIILGLSIAAKKGMLGNQKGIKVSVDTVKTRNIIESVSSSGKIFPVEEVKLSPDVSGEVILLSVEEGQQVSKGQLIATINQSVLSAESPDISSLIAAQTGMPMPVAQPTKPASKTNRKTNIYAPSSGIVTRLNVKQGERVVPAMQMGGTEMLRIADMSKMKVDVEIGENDIQKIKVGDTAIIEVDAYSKKKFKGFVSKIAQSNTSNNMAAMAMNSDQISNYTVSVEISPTTYQDIVSNNRKFPFRPGMSAQVEILTTHHNQVIVVPIAAVTARDLDSTNIEENPDDAMKEYVFVLQPDNKIKLTEVKSGVQDNTFIEIISGLKSGDVIISGPYSAITLRLKDKAKVQVVSKSELVDKEK
jgi:HlyD family secretion protein